MPENLDNLKQDLLNDHWKHVYNWAGISVQKLSERYDCSMDDVRSVMFEIQKTHPRPKRNPKKATCKYCDAEIVWIGKHPCDPPVLKGVTADEKVHSFRQSHFATCPYRNEARKSSDPQRNTKKC